MLYQCLPSNSVLSVAHNEFDCVSHRLKYFSDTKTEEINGSGSKFLFKFILKYALIALMKMSIICLPFVGVIDDIVGRSQFL